MIGYFILAPFVTIASCYAFKWWLYRCIRAHLASFAAVEVCPGTWNLIETTSKCCTTALDVVLGIKSRGRRAILVRSARRILERDESVASEMANDPDCTICPADI